MHLLLRLLGALSVRPYGTAQKRHCLASLDNLPSTQWIATVFHSPTDMQLQSSQGSRGSRKVGPLQRRSTVPAQRLHSACISDAAASRRASPQAHATCSMRHSASCASKRLSSGASKDILMHSGTGGRPSTRACCSRSPPLSMYICDPGFCRSHWRGTRTYVSSPQPLRSRWCLFWVDLQRSRQQARAGELYVSYGQQCVFLVSPSVAAPAGISREISPLVARLQPYRTIGRNCMSLLMGRL